MIATINNLKLRKKINIFLKMLKYLFLDQLFKQSVKKENIN